LGVSTSTYPRDVVAVLGCDYVWHRFDQDSGGRPEIVWARRKQPGMMAGCVWFGGELSQMEPVDAKLPASDVSHGDDLPGVDQHGGGAMGNHQGPDCR
jgi:G:T-mismatch repair DNA endonuclease (very short patch repair protein)